MHTARGGACNVWRCISTPNVRSGGFFSAAWMGASRAGMLEASLRDTDAR
jgi:hypothetical protein